MRINTNLRECPECGEQLNKVIFWDFESNSRIVSWLGIDCPECGWESEETGLIEVEE